jgi:hypothetical protein
MWLGFSIKGTHNFVMPHWYCYAWRQFYLILVELILEAELDHCFKLVLNLALDFGLSPNYCFLEESAQVELGLWIIGLLSWPVFLLSSKVWLIHSLEIHILELHCCWVVWLCWSLKYWLCYYHIESVDCRRWYDKFFLYLYCYLILEVVLDVLAFITVVSWFCDW